MDEVLERVGDSLRDRREMVAVAESSTGGLLSSHLTDVPGSSAYFDRGIVSYSNRAKVEVLGVRTETLETHGAVSEPTAREMARGVCARSNTTWGVSTTGVAGPGGGTDRNPVGTVYIGVARATDSGVDVVSANRYEFDGDRGACKRQFTRQALIDLHAAVLD